MGKGDGAGRPPRAGEPMDTELRVRIARSEAAQLARFCERQDMTKSDVTRRALAAYGAIKLDEDG